MKTLCTICARGGSKRLPGKNTKMFAGKPLIEHTIDQAIRFGFEDIVVSSDCVETLLLADQYPGVVGYHRPDEYATDDASKIETIIDALQWMSELRHSYDYVVDLAVTSPLRALSDIKNAYAKLITPNICEKVTSVWKADWVVTHGQALILNGAINGWDVDVLTAGTVQDKFTYFFGMPKERSIDIDTEFDFKVAEFIYETNFHNNLG